MNLELVQESSVEMRLITCQTFWPATVGSLFFLRVGFWGLGYVVSITWPMCAICACRQVADIQSLPSARPQMSAPEARHVQKNKADTMATSA